MNTWCDWAVTAAFGLQAPGAVARAPGAVARAPGATFGVFVTITLPRALAAFPYDIHGCMGYWERAFQPASQQELKRQCAVVAAKAAWVDDRGRAHAQPLQQDVDAKFEVSLMQAPLMEVNVRTGRLPNGRHFNAAVYGLIVVADGGTATYLPGVFRSSIAWQTLTASLVQKAGTALTETTKFLAYTCLREASTIWEVVTGGFVPRLLQEISVSMDAHILKDSRVPYGVTKLGRTTYRDSDEVRNYALVNDCKKLTLSTAARAVLEKALRRKPQDPAAYPFYALATGITRPYCALMYGKIRDMEPVFAQGEAGIALSELCYRDAPLRAVQKQMQTRAAARMAPVVNDIFELNWQAKFLVSLEKHQPHEEHVKLVERAYRNWFKLDTLAALETNFLAVALECGGALFVTHADTRDCLFPLLCALQDRYKNGVFYFTDQTARLDITGHVIEALAYCALQA